MRKFRYPVTLLRRLFEIRTEPSQEPEPEPEDTQAAVPVSEPGVNSKSKKSSKKSVDNG